MSTEDQINVAGRIVVERSEAKKQYGLLRSSIQSKIDKLATARRLLIGGVGEDHQGGLKLINEAIADGGLDKLKAEIEQSIVLKDRVAELHKQAMEAGIELG